MISALVIWSAIWSAILNGKRIVDGLRQSQRRSLSASIQREPLCYKEPVVLVDLFRLWQFEIAGDVKG